MAKQAFLTVAVAVLGLATMTQASPIYVPLPVIVSPAHVDNTIVQNGDFEADNTVVTTPTDWGTRVGNVFAFPVSATGNPTLNSLVTAVDSSNEITLADTNTGGGGIYTAGGWSQTISVSSGATYVLGADIWNFSNIAGISPNNAAQNHVAIFDGVTPLAALTILPTDAGGSQGYFGYSSFTATSSTLTVEVYYDNGTGPTGDDLVAVWDNVSVTPTADFVAPTPEPASLGLLAIGGLTLLRRRR